MKIKVEVIRKSDKKLIYGNSGGNDVKSMFESDVSEFNNADYDIVWTDTTEEDNKIKRRYDHIKTVKQKLKELKNDEVSSLTSPQIKKLLKQILDVIVERDELSD